MKNKLVIDGDYPMALGALDINRDLTRPIEEVRATAPGGTRFDASWPADGTMASLPEMRRGLVAAALMKIHSRILRIQGPHKRLWGYQGREAAHAAAHAHLAYYQILEKTGQLKILRTGKEMSHHIKRWEDAANCESLPVGAIIGMEGADPILEPDEVHDWWSRGVRVISLCHYGVSTYAHGTGVSGGLFPLAGQLLREMEALGVILDMTHTADESFWGALEQFNGPVLASHQNCRALVPAERQFSDEQLRAIIERGGVVGASMDTWMLYPGGDLDWSAEIPARRDRFPRDAVTLNHLVDHIDHVCQLAGNTEHAAIGADTDGQSGKDGAPHEIDTVADYQKVAAVLEKRGFACEDIDNIMYRNWQRFFEKWLPEESPSVG